MHDDVVDDVGKRVLKAMKQVLPGLLNDWYFDNAFSQGFGAKVKYAKSAVDLDGTGVGFPRGTETSKITELSCNLHRLQSRKAALGIGTSRKQRTQNQFSKYERSLKANPRR